MGKQNRPEQIPKVVKEPTYPIIPPPFTAGALYREVFHGLKSVDHKRSRDEFSQQCSKVVKKDPTRRMEYVLYLIKLGAMLQEAIRELEITGSYDCSKINPYLKMDASVYQETDKDGKYMAMHLYFNNCLDILRSSLQSFIATAGTSAVAYVSEQMKWGVKTPTRE